MAAGCAGSDAGSRSTGGVHQWPLTQTSLTCSTGVGAPSSVKRPVISAGNPQVAQFSSGSEGILMSGGFIVVIGTAGGNQRAELARSREDHPIRPARQSTLG